MNWRDKYSSWGSSGIACQMLALALFVLLPCGAYAQTASSTSAAAQTLKIGYIDVKRLIDNAPQFIEAKTKLEHEFAARNDKIKTDEAKLAELKQRYGRDSPIMAQGDADALKRLIETTERDNNRQRDEARAEYNERAGAETHRNLQLINDTAIDYARVQGYDIVVASQAVLYASARIDITDAVLQKLRQINNGAKP